MNCRQRKQFGHKKDLIAHMNALKDTCMWHRHAHDTIQQFPGGPEWFQCSKEELTEASKQKKMDPVGCPLVTRDDLTPENHILRGLNHILDKPTERRRWCCPIGTLKEAAEGKQWKTCRTRQPFDTMSKARGNFYCNQFGAGREWSE